MTPELKRCIFCQLPRKMTSEHVWGEWTKVYVARNSNKHTHANVFVPNPGRPDPADVRTRAGDHLDSQVRIVCAECNSGWMGGIQESAKPYLIPLFDGEACDFHERAQHVVSAWTAMATMTSEHLSMDKKRIAIPQSDRDWMMNRQCAPQSWGIWIGRYERQSWPTQWVKATFPIADVDNIADIKPDQIPDANLQTTSFTIGQLFVFVMSCQFPEIAGLWDWRTAPTALTRLKRIWPISTKEIRWPPDSFGDKDAEAFATAVIRYYDDLAVRKGFATLPTLSKK
jgi:hypothetical protein